MSKIIEENQEWINSTWEKIDKKLVKVAVKSRNKLPYTTDENGVHDNKAVGSVDWWTNGFWGGMMWLMYKETGNEEYRKTAEASEKMLDESLKRYKRLHHDVGFMWHLTSGASYRITGNEESCVRNLFAASTLFSRFNVDGKYIRAWNGEGQAGWSIIDCLMNLPLLYWASEEIGDDRFKKIAVIHTDMALKDHIREDGSVNHIVEHDTNTGEVTKVYGGQGYSETSCWSRGLAWAIYGMVLAYIHTKKPEYLEAAKKCSNYFIEHVKKSDYVPVIDFVSPEEPVYYDTTAGVCAVCGFLELAKLVDESEAEFYTDAAIKILKATERFCVYDDSKDCLVTMGSERYPHDDYGFKGLHIPIIYGDFFFVEAFLKLRGNDFLIW